VQSTKSRFDEKQIDAAYRDLGNQGAKPAGSPDPVILRLEHCTTQLLAFLILSIAAVAIVASVQSFGEPAGSQALKRRPQRGTAGAVRTSAEGGTTSEA
jgi:hypothetical protein